MHLINLFAATGLLASAVQGAPRVANENVRLAQHSLPLVQPDSNIVPIAGSGWWFALPALPGGSLSAVPGTPPLDGQPNPF